MKVYGGSCYSIPSVAIKRMGAASQAATRRRNNGKKVALTEVSS